MTVIESHEVGHLDPRAERSRQRALAAGWEILLNEGWDALSQRRVAEVAGIGRATVYRHWPDRISLLQDTCAAAFTRLHTVPSGELRADLCAELGTLRRELIEGGFDKIMAALTERCFWEPDLRAVKRAANDHASTTIRQILRDAIERGELPADLDIDSALGQLVGPIVYRHFFADLPVPKEFLEQSVDGFLTRCRSTQSGAVTQ